MKTFIPLDIKIKEESKRKNTRWDIIEKDYALSYILLGISNHPILSNFLVFKGGTALKKCYFGDYRFSEDLDFSAINDYENKSFEKPLAEAILISKNYLYEYGPFDIQLRRKPERAPHPAGQEAFLLSVAFPGHKSPQGFCKIKIEITRDEPIILQPVKKSILHNYNEEFDGKIACYHIEEIIAEKMRALLQTNEKLITRGWNRPRARDYYDLWYILNNQTNNINKKNFQNLLKSKCDHKMVNYNSIDDFFTPHLVKEANKHWKSNLHLLTNDLPNCEYVLSKTRDLILSLLWN
jgi:hypothetical protein